MKVLAVLVLIVWSSTGTACGPQSSNASASIVEGIRYDYRIPALFAKERDLELWRNLESADSNRAVSLLIRKTQIQEIAPLLDADLTVLMFDDKNYQKDPGLGKFAKTLIEGATPFHVTGADSRFHVYVDEVGFFVHTYFATFDPTVPDINPSEDDFFVQLTTAAERDPGPAVLIPKPVCVVYMIRDGILVQIGSVGAICNSNEFDAVMSSFNELMSRWRISKAARHPIP